ncbi:hypothetical protein [Actinomycetospora soli]|uniref:hypothetical protein n=1 Tax=Actinomycetospora soli TaxID=2893887 RepID=UPI001E456457|nr:hypothetical protein [Actinomycetospora soli]MCD2185873.1 hypothetical protein [Actinomycetospora soli]
MDTLWLMCGVAVVAVGLLMMFGGSKARSLDDVYARRAEARAQAPAAAPTDMDTDMDTATDTTPTTVVVATPVAEAGRHRMAT